MAKIQRFRMVELLAIAASLGLLFWLLFCDNPFQKAQPKGGYTCASNLKMLGVAANLYAAANAGNLPGPQPWGVATDNPSWDKPVAIQLGAKLRPEEMLFTERGFDNSHPFSNSLKTFTCLKDPDGGVPWMTARSYSENLGDGLAATGIEPTGDKIPASKVVFAAGTAWLVENYAGATGFGAANAAGDTWIDIARADSAYDQQGHGSIKIRWGVKIGKETPRINVLMHDGHVELLKKDDLSRTKPELLKYVK